MRSQIPLQRLVALLGLAAAACLLLLAAPARGDPIVGKWNALVTDAMAQKKIGANAGKAPLMPLANLLAGGRIMSILHVAQWKAVNGVLQAQNVTSMDDAKARLPALLPDLQAAVAGAGKAVLGAALPEMDAQAEALYWAQAGDEAGQQAGAVAVGAAAAKEVLALRATDGANATGPDYMGSNETGKWRPTPPLFKPGGGVLWQKVTPWVLDSPDQLRPVQPPALKSKEYQKSYMEVMAVGNATSAGRTKAHTEEVYLWNELPDVLLFSVVDQATKDSDLLDAARIYAMTAAAGMDARVACFDAKYFYSTWRPVTAIPVGNGVNFPADPSFTTVIPTPPTPEFPSGHAIHGEAILELLRRARGGGASAPTKAAAAAADAMEVTLTSPTPLPVVKARRLQETAPVTRSYKSLSEVSEQLVLSRINGGLHYRFTQDVSLKVGQAVARKVWADFDRKYTTVATTGGNKVQEEEKEGEERGGGALRGRV